MSSWFVRASHFPFGVGKVLGTVEAPDRTEAQNAARDAKADDGTVRFPQPFCIEPATSSVESLERALRKIKPRRQFDHARRFVRAKPTTETEHE